MKQKQAKVLFTECSPFDVACFDVEHKIIVVDKKFKNSKFLNELLEHETAHKKSKKEIDLAIEFIHPVSEGLWFEIIHKKPLWLVSEFVPIMAYKNSGKWRFGIEWHRIFFDIALVIMLYELILALSNLL